MTKLSSTLLLCLGVLHSALADQPTFQESDGLVVMEAESTGSSLGRWDLKTNIHDFQGAGHLEFTGNSIMNGPPKSPLRYEFTISTPGTYRLIMRAHKRLETKRDDLSNDCYVAVSGTYEAGGTASTSILRKDHKFFGGSEEGWGRAELLDVDHKKHPALYKFRAGETYKLTVSGRSKNFNIDRILFVHESHNPKKILSQNPAESTKKGGSPSSGSSLPERVVRELTNRKGQTITAHLLGKTPTTLITMVSGRKVEIPLSTLSDEDQTFIKGWTPG